MISLKVLSTAGAMALALSMVAPSASFAQNQGFKGHGGPGGAPAARVGGGGGGGGMGLRAGGGGGGGGGGIRQGGGAPGPQFSGGGPRVSGGGPRVYGGGGGYHHHGGGGGFFPGAVAGAVIGGAIASQGYYGSPGYYAAPAYDANGYYDEGTVAAVPVPDGDDSVAYCMQTYRSYDPRSGTYLGNDGYRHPCP